ncbi:MAG: hypothetical protein ACYDB6_10525 [Candidatus Limnocylindrales bacterium]
MFVGERVERDPTRLAAGDDAAFAEKSPLVAQGRDGQIEQERRTTSGCREATSHRSIVNT